MLKILLRVLRWVGFGFLFLIPLVGLGRLGQKALDSWWYFADFGPYLQVVGSHEATIRWETESPGLGVVRYGLSPESLAQTLGEEEEGRMHRIRLTGLQPGTEYWYSLGDRTYSFRTAPLPGSDRPVRLWVLGDPGYTGDPVEAVRASALAWMEAHPRPGLPDLDAILTTGDNAYRSGRREDFHHAVFGTFAEEVARYPYWPAYGNHDSRRWAFFDLFEFPADGQAGGVPSGHDNFFSFDYGPVHVVVLDTESGDLDADGPMVRWLEKDLAATGQPWRIVVFHHPPYTKGSHDSDDPYDSSSQMIDTRENILPVLERYDTDLVLTGHSHLYERSHLLDCHYGASSTMAPAMVLDDGADGAYNKPAGKVAHQGTVYAVVGASSQLNGGSGNTIHPAMPIRELELGSLVIDVEGPRLNAHYVTATGMVIDEFSVVKDLEEPRPRGCNG